MTRGDRRANTAFSALRHRDFATFWTAALISNSAAWLQNVVVPFLMFELTGSNGLVGLAAFASLFPAFLLTPFAGVLADRVSRRLILVCSQSVSALLALAYWGLWVGDGLTSGWILFLQFLSGISAGFQVAAWQSFVPQLVPRESLLHAVRLNSIQFTVARALGPLVAIAALGFLGTGFAFMINALTYLGVVATILAARPIESVAPRAETLRAILGEGFAFVRAHASLRYSTAAGFAIAFLGQSLAFSLAPGLSEEIFDLGETGQRLMLLALGCGSLLMSSFIIVLGDRLPRSLLTRFGLGTYAAGVLAVGATDIFAVALFGFGLMGIAHLAVAVSLNTAIQIQVDDDIRGRVISFYILGVLAGLPLGAIISGALADVIGLRAVMLVAGTLFVGFNVWAWVVANGFAALDATRIDGSGPPDRSVR